MIIEEIAVSVILVVDEHSIYRGGLRRLIETRFPHFRVVEASRLPHSDIDEGFNLILIDSASLSYGTLELLAEWHEVRPKARIAVLSGAKSRVEALHYLSAGFHGFLHKLQSEEELLDAIHDLLSGRIYIPIWVVDGDSDYDDDIPFREDVEQETLKLTRRQNEVLTLLARGMSNKEIARELDIAEGTSKIHTAALLRALGARNRTEAAFKAAKIVKLRGRDKSVQDGERVTQRSWLDRGIARKFSS
jgi:DNA-binding NarL/FixJ family response regulator